MALLTGLVLNFSCQQPKENTALATFEISDHHIVDFDEAVTSIDFIPLKNRSESPVNLNCSIWDLEVTDKYFIYSTICNPEAKIHFFDLEGNYLKSFENSGDGPEEYQAIQGIDFESNTINIAVGGGMIKQYDLDDFKFIRAITLNSEASFISSMARISETKWLYPVWYDGKLNENGEFSAFRITETSTDSISDLPIYATPLTSEIAEGAIAKMDQSYMLNFAFSDTLYHYENNKTSPYALLDLGERSPKPEDLKMNQD